MQPEENKFITLLTPREQGAVDNINAVLNGDGSDPESGPGAWGDCGEVDVPVVLEALARLSRVPAPSPEGDRLPDAFTNAIGVLGHLGREGTAEHLQTVAKMWQGHLCQIPALLASGRQAEAFKAKVVEVLITHRDAAFAEFTVYLNEGGDPNAPIPGAEVHEELNKIAKALGLTLLETVKGDQPNG